MLAYITRRFLYAILILVGVNLLTFVLFFKVNTPDDIARMQLGTKRVTQEAINKWKAERGYDKPLILNTKAQGMGMVKETIYFEKSFEMFSLNFGRADDGRDIAREIVHRAGPSLALAIPVFAVGLVVNITFALIMACSRNIAACF